MDKSSATKMVQNYLKSMPPLSGDNYVIVEEMTCDKPYGWIFYFSSKLYIETGDFMRALGGNGPIVVLKTSGELHQLGSSLPGDEAVREFEVKMGLSYS